MESQTLKSNKEINYYEIIWLHPVKWELLCLILGRHKAILCKDLYQSMENNRVQNMNSALGLKELEDKLDSHNCVRICVFPSFPQSSMPITRFKSCAALLQNEKQPRELCQTNSCPYKLQTKAQSSIFFIIV